MSNTRDRIISVAYDLFSEKGYNATLDEIAKAVGIRTPSIYSHFECKEDLFLVVISQEIGDFFRSFEIAQKNLAEQSTYEQIRGSFSFVIGYFKPRGHIRFWRNLPLISQDNLRNKCRDLILQNDQKFTYEMIEIFRKGVERKELRSNVTESSALLWLAMIQGILDGILLYDGDEAFLESFATKTWEAFWDGVKY